MPNRCLWTLFALCGASGVGLGAFGAHALKARLTAAGHLETWETAVSYHLIHTVAALAVLTAAERASNALFSAAARCWLAGVVLFSGSLYALSLGGPKWLGPVTPLGGIAFIAGWVCVALAAVGAKNAKR